MSKILYRYEIEYKSEDGDTSIHLRELPVVRETEKMYFVNRDYYGLLLRGIKKDAHNTFAYNTKEKAKAHFIRRTNTRIAWFNFWKEECEKALELAKELWAKEVDNG